MSAVSIRKVLIPAAGYGKRSGTPPAKELFPDPESGRPLIEFSLRCAEEADVTPVVIVRRQKTALVEYLERRGGVELCVIEESEEWPDSLRQGKPYWGSENVVLLPDTRFAPLDIAARVFRDLAAGNHCVFATFDVADRKSWGMVARDGGRNLIAEKPAAPSGLESEQAWGVFGFRHEYGDALMATLLESGRDHQWKELTNASRYLELESFCDLTRPA
jgi:hypothetical protein